MFTKYWNYWLLVLLILAFLGLYVYKNIETFEDSYPGYNTTLKYMNDTSDIRDRHPVYNSLVQDLNFKFKKAYNYELENSVYQDALNRTFNLNKVCLVKQDYTEEQPLNRVLDPNIETAYQQAINYIQAKIKESVQFDLPDGSLQIINPIQMVHDRLISYQIHKNIPDHYILYIETVLYREAKYHAKHVEFTVLVQRNKGWNIQVLDASVKGIIFEDQIALFPVQGNDRLVTNIDLSPATFSGPRFSSRITDVVNPEYTTERLKTSGLGSEEIQKLRGNLSYI
jgi:hypothetical protein